MSDDKPQKISVGFQGGGVVTARVAPAELSRLRDALGGAGWHDLTGEESTIALHLEKVVYVLVDNEAHRVGFGG